MLPELVAGQVVNGGRNEGMEGEYGSGPVFAFLCVDSLYLVSLSIRFI